MAPPNSFGGSGNTMYFAFMLLRSTGYGIIPKIVHTRREMRFLICGEYKPAQADVGVLDRYSSQIMLIVQDHRSSGSCPHARLVADAIATFQHNNELRVAASSNSFAEQCMHLITIGDD